MQMIGLDIGGTHLRIGIVRADNSAVCVEQLPQAQVLKGDALQSLADFILDYMQRHKVLGQIAAVCAALPAAIDKDRAVVLNAPNISGFDGVNVKEQLQRRLELPVCVERDVNALLVYDLHRYRIDMTKTVVACYVGTGLGNALWINGNVYYGENGVAGELGHIPAWDVETPCACGNPSCVETFVGGKYLAALQQSDFENTPISDLFKTHGADERLAAYVRHLAVPIASEVNILDPQTLILGGGVLGMADFPTENLLFEIKRHLRKPFPAERLQIVFSENKGENGVIGAGILARSVADGTGAKKPPVLCPSMMCADCGRLKEEVDALEQAGCDMFHIDIMDGRFVPNFAMGLQDMACIAKETKKPLDVHLMIERPGDYVELFAKNGAGVIYIHPEADVHTPRTLQKIKDCRVLCGIAVNPGTAVETVAPLLSMVDYLLVMTVNPGFAGQQYLSMVDEKIDAFLRLRDKFSYQIIIDGACSPERIRTLHAKGVDGFVLGTSALFGKDRDYGKIIAQLKAM